MTSQLNVALHHNHPGSLVCLVYHFDMLSMRVCTTRHRQTSGWLVQELNVCTVVAPLGLLLVFQISVIRKSGYCFLVGRWFSPRTRIFSSINQSSSHDFALTLMLLVASLGDTHWCKRKAEKVLKPWYLRVLSEGYPMDTNMTGYRWF